jgi:hypothetical protein
MVFDDLLDAHARGQELHIGLIDGRWAFAVLAELLDGGRRPRLRPPRPWRSPPDPIRGQSRGKSCRPAKL